MTDVHGVARDQLRAFIERIERLEEEKKTIADDVKDVYGEAKAMGFIPAMIKKIVALRKKDEQQRMEEEAILDTYLHALGMLSQHDLFEEPHHPETREVIDPKLAQTIVTGMQTETGRKALMAAVDIMIAREEADEEFQAKASGDNGATWQSEKVTADRVTGDVSRSSRGDDSPASNFQSDDGAVAAVKGKARLANADGVEPPSSGQIDPNEDRREDQSLDGNADANVGGDHVTAQSPATDQAVALVQAATATKPLRPLCRHPGEHCGGYGSTHCGSCLKASKETEVAA